MHNFFYGWYLKCQSDTQTLAIIPAVHQIGQKCTCSIQMITDNDVWTVSFPAWEFRHVRRSPQGQALIIGNNLFCKNGVRLSLNTSRLQIEGKLKFRALTPLKYDIMGPFALMPFMECRHKVFSMRHIVNGAVFINGQKYVFKNAVGYWEGDQGRSFPKEYLWTQCIFDRGSIMLSVADIPIMGIHFTGIIGVVYINAREYRLATYLGARVKQIQNGTVQIVQGDTELEVRLLEKKEHALNAPVNGNMTRKIHESAACRAYYRFSRKGRTVFEFETDRASFEYEYKK